MATIEIRPPTALALVLLAGFWSPSSLAREMPFLDPVPTGSGLQLRDVVSADFNGDGKPDTATISEGQERVVWQWYTGEHWLQGSVTDSLDLPVGIAAADMDCDGDPDLVIGESGTDSLLWYRNDDNAGNWSLGGTLTTAAADLVAFTVGNFSRDGAADVIGVVTSGDVMLWRRTGGCDSINWVASAVAAGLGAISDIVTADFDGDGHDDIAVSESGGNEVFWLENPGALGLWSQHLVQSSLASPARLAAGDIDGDGDIDLAAPLRGDDEFVWWANSGDGQSWTEHPIGTLELAYRVALGDIDRDGDLDVAGLSSGATGLLVWWDNLDGAGAEWQRHEVDDSPETWQSLLVADLGSDGDTDIVVTAMGANRLHVYENASSARSGLLPQGLFTNAYPFFQREIADLQTADMDGDGDLDLVMVERDTDIPQGVVQWFENTGVDSNGQLALGGPHHVMMDTTRSIESVAAGDIDRDGDIDLFVGYWFNVTTHGAFCRNTGTSVWACTDVFGFPGLYRSLDSLSLADIDGDGDLDLLGTIVDPLADNSVTWFEQDGNPALPASWTRHDVGFGNASQGRLGAIDFDADGDLDLVGSHNDWWRQDAGSWSAESIPGDPMLDQAVGDLDVDGDPDVAAVIATIDGTGLAWFENDLAGSDFTQTGILAPSSLHLEQVELADLDGDGDPDVVAGIVENGVGRIAWFENRTRSEQGWLEHPMMPSGTRGTHLVPADFNRDGRNDLVVAEAETMLVSWINGGGQVALAATDASPAALVEGTEAALMKFELIHRGRDGEAPLSWDKLALRFERSPEVALTDSELAALVHALRLYLDDGSGNFDPAEDILIGSLPLPSLDRGLGVLSLPASDPDLQQLPGAPPASYFLTVELAPDAQAAGIPGLLVIHAADMGSGACNVEFATPLLLEFAATTTATIIVSPSGPLFSDRFESSP